MITEAECAFSWELQLWLHRLRRPQFWGTDSSHQTPRRLLEKARACRFLHRTVGMWGLTTLSCQKTAQRVQVLREARGQEAAVGRSLRLWKGSEFSLLPCSVSPPATSLPTTGTGYSLYFLKVGLLSLMLHSGPFPSPLLKENWCVIYNII